MISNHFPFTYGRSHAWLILFVIYQQLQDRVLQPLLYRSAVKIHPVVAIISILFQRGEFDALAVGKKPEELAVG